MKRIAAATIGGASGATLGLGVAFVNGSLAANPAQTPAGAAAFVIGLAIVPMVIGACLGWFTTNT